MNAPERVAALATIPQSLSFHEIMRLLPYGPPWLLLDRVVSWGKGEIVVQKAISGAEANMSAHLKDGPSIMPGALQLEFVNQAAMLMMILLNSSGERNDPTDGAGVLAQCKCKYISPAYIGEVITGTVKLVEVVGNMTMYQGEITCGDRKVASITAVGALVTDTSTLAKS